MFEKVICLNNQEYPTSLSFGKTYDVVYDDEEIPDGYIRVKDDNGDCYLYPMKYFRVVE